MMKKYWLVATGLVLVLAVVGLSGCYTGRTPLAEFPSELRLNFNSQQEGIWVSGRGEVTVTPDIAILSLGIEAQADTVAEAQTRANEAMEKVMNVLKDNDVADKDIQTQHFSIRQRTRWDENKQQEVVIGYRVTNMVTAKVREIEDTGFIIDAVAVAGGDFIRIQGIAFSVDDPSPYHKEAREKAMADARAKAEQLADQADVKVGTPTYISESMPYYPPMPRTAIYEDVKGGAMETTISPGELDITLTVQVVYSIR